MMKKDSLKDEEKERKGQRFNCGHKPMTASHMAKSQSAERPVHSMNRQLSVTVKNRGPNVMKGTS